jgi:DNA-binding NarL/FixJ family response regulator
MLGELDIQDKRYAEADAHLRQSLTLAQACAAPFEQALTLLAFADLGAAAGKDEEARSMLAQAREICEPLDAKPALARVDEIERRLDQARKATSFPAGLSPREVDVLRLVVQGLTDAEIAEQLFLSSRTVSSYLSSVYNKLGVNSRTAAAGFAIREGLA